MAHDLRDRVGLILRTFGAASNGEPSKSRFLLGGQHEHRVNVPAQQHRALNLVWALRERGLLVDSDGNGDDRQERSEDAGGKRVVVIGAGVAGATFAAAAARVGAHVVLIDEHEEPVTVQRAATQRFLHPTLFDWPNPGSTANQADLPVNNWQSGVASDVRNQLLAGFVVALTSAQAPELTSLAQCLVVHVRETETNEVLVEYLPLDHLAAGEPRQDACQLTADVVVIATGFLPERRIPHTVSGNYWKDDRLAELGKKILIVGDGDGALTELFRVALDGGQNQRIWLQQRLVHIVSRTTRELARELMDIEGNIRNNVLSGSLDLLSAPRSPLSDLDGQLAPRTDREVSLIGRRPILRSNSFLINRFLAARLALTYPFVTLTDLRIDPTDVEEIASEWDVIWRGGPPPRDPMLADPFFSLRGLVEAIGHSAVHSGRAGLAGDVLDQTRAPAWGDSITPATFTVSVDLVQALDGLRPPATQPGGVSPREIADLPCWMRAPEEFFPTSGNAVASVPWPDHFERIVDTARRLRAVAAAFPDAAGLFWWFDSSDVHPWISLDLLAIASDLPPSQVALSIAANRGGALNLVLVTLGSAALPRVWVEVAIQRNLLEEKDEDIADTLAVSNAPATWDDFIVRSQPANAAPILGPTPVYEHDQRITERAIEALREVLGAARAIIAAEGLTRSSHLPTGLVLDLLALASDPDVLQDEQLEDPDVRNLLAGAVVDLFTRAIASQDSAVARPALLLFGQIVRRSPGDSEVFSWALATIVGGRGQAISAVGEPNPESIGRALMLTSVARLRSALSESEHAEESIRAPLPFTAADIRAGVQRLVAVADEFDELLVITAHEWPEGRPDGELAERLWELQADRAVIDLSYAGVLAEPYPAP